MLRVWFCNGGFRMKEKIEFWRSYKCKSGLICGLCRDLEGGRGMRDGLFVSYGIEGDFECPRGKPWGAKSKEAKKEPRWLVDARKLCRACMRKGCPNLIDGCCGGGVMLRIQYPCLAEKFTIEVTNG